MSESSGQPARQSGQDVRQPAKDQQPVSGLEDRPQKKTVLFRALSLAAIILFVLVTMLAAFIWAGPLASGALFLTRRTSTAPASHDLLPSYRPKHKGHVDVSTGLYVREDDDLVLARTPVFTFTRTYLSQDRVSRQFGVGTTSNAEWWLIGDPARFQWAELILADGSRARFDRTSWGTSCSTSQARERAVR